MGLFDSILPGGQLAKHLSKLEQYPDALLLDVRTAEEFSSGHLPGAFNLPLDRLDEIRFSKDRPLFVYCYSGARSAQACSLLQKMGYQASNIGGVAGYRGPLE